MRRPVARALDVGTGNGIQALLAARHAEHVVATDVSERALAFAAFNCALNGVENVELRQGSFLEPVAGEQFDLVVANPPYVISPETSLVFRDSGLGRDRVSADLVRALPSVLAEGGFASVMVSWIQPGDDPAAAPADLARGLRLRRLDPRTRARTTRCAAAAAWNRDAPSPAEYTERIERWLDYFRREGIEAIAYGAIVMRRRSGDELGPLDAAARTGRSTRRGPARAAVRRAGLPGATSRPTRLCSSERFAVVEGATLEQTLAPAAGAGSCRSRSFGSAAGSTSSPGSTSTRCGS